MSRGLLPDPGKKGISGDFGELGCVTICLVVILVIVVVSSMLVLSTVVDIVWVVLVGEVGTKHIGCWSSVCFYTCLEMGYLRKARLWFIAFKLVSSFTLDCPYVRSFVRPRFLGVPSFHCVLIDYLSYLVLPSLPSRSRVNKTILSKDISGHIV